MDTKAALGAAAGLTLTVAGGVSALFLSIGQIDQPAAAAEPAVVTYIDPAPAPEVVLMYPDGTLVDAEPAPARPEPLAAAEPTYGEYEEHNDYEEHDNYEEADEYEDHDEYDDYEEYEEHDEYEDEDDDDDYEHDDD